MMYLVENFTNPCELFVDFFAGTFTVANVYLLLPKDRHFVGAICLGFVLRVLSKLLLNCMLASYLKQNLI